MNSKEELLDKIEEIGTIKGKLSFRDRALTSSYGLYVQSGRLPGGVTQYMAGGRLLKKLVFVREADGTRTVKKYQPGDWELKVDETLALCRTLERASKGQTEWTEEKLEAYWADETWDPALVARVDRVDSAWQEHNSQLNEVWQMTGPEQRKDITKSFFNELEQEWPTEFIEMQLEKVMQATSEQFIKGVKTAYLVGYMAGKGWISMEEMTDVNLWLGDELTAHIRSILKGAKSRGTAFASAFASVAAEGTNAALASGVQNYESTKREIIEEIIRTEGTTLLRRQIQNSDATETPTVGTSPFKPTDVELLTAAFLGAPSIYTEKLESMLKKLLKDDYGRCYESAKQRIISSH